MSPYTEAWQQLKALIVKVPTGDLFETPDTRLEEAKRVITLIAPVYEMGFVNDIFMSAWRRIITPQLSAAEPLIQPHALHMDWNDLAIHIVREITPAFLKPHRFVLDIPKLKAVLSGTIQIKDPREVWITADQIIQTSLLQLVRQMADRDVGINVYLLQITLFESSKLDFAVGGVLNGKCLSKFAIEDRLVSAGYDVEEIRLVLEAIHRFSDNAQA
jgi:hypothetical protein